MRRKLTTLKAKQGHSQNGASRQQLDEAAYRSTRASPQSNALDSQYTGSKQAARPRDQAVSIHTKRPEPEG